MERKRVSVFAKVADFFLPSHCFGCSRSTKNGAVICDDCYNAIEKLGSRVCDVCGHTDKKCECDKVVFHYSAMVVPFKNEGVAQRGIYRLKFARGEACADFYIHHMVQRLIDREVDLNFDGVVYVPSKLIKTVERGYNVSKVLAQGVADKIGVKLLKNVIKRSFGSEIQHKDMNRQQRFDNGYKSYKCAKAVSGRILLVDDIKTTGATLEACSRALLMSGADQVVCLTALLGEK